MITFGYKNTFSSILRALSAFAIGLVMVIRTEATTDVVRIIALLLVATGIVSVLYALWQKNRNSGPLPTFNAVVDLVLGTVMFLWPAAISGIIVFLIGGVLIFFGILQLLVLGSTISLLGRNTFSLLLSVLAVVGGIVVIFNPFSMKIISVVAGVSLIVYSVTELLSLRRVKKAVEVHEIRFREGRDGDGPADFASTVEDVEYERVDDRPGGRRRAKGRR